MEEQKYSKVLIFIQFRTLNFLFWYTIPSLVTLIFEIYPHYLKNDLFMLISELFILFLLTSYQFMNHYQKQIGWKGFLYVISIFFCLEFILDYKFEQRTIEKIKSIYYEGRIITQNACYFLILLISLKSVNSGYDFKILLLILISTIYLAAFNYHKQFKIIEVPFQQNTSIQLKFQKLDSLMLKNAFREIIRYYLQIILFVTLFPTNQYIFIYLFFHLFSNKYIGIYKDKIIKYIDVLQISNLNYRSEYYFENLNKYLILILIYQISLPILFSLIYEDIPAFNQNEILFQIISVLMIFDLYYMFKNVYQQIIVTLLKGPQFVQCTTENQLKNLILKYDSKESTQLKVILIKQFESDLVYKILFNNFKNVVIDVCNSYKIKIENKWILKIQEPSNNHSNCRYQKILFYSLPLLSPEIETIFIFILDIYNILPFKDQIKLLLLSTQKRYPLYIYYNIKANARNMRLLELKSMACYNNKIVKKYECSNNSIIYQKIVFQQIFGNILTYNPIFIYQDLYL